MKYILVFIVAVVTACGNEMSNDISGTYVRFAEGEFSKSWDTLIIGVQDAKGATFVVQERSGVQRIKEGILQPKTTKKNSSIVVYDASTNQLQDMKTGLLYSFPGRRTDAGRQCGIYQSKVAVMRIWVGLILCVGILYAPAANAQDPFIKAAKAAVKKVIKAIDLKVQRLQNKTIWLQNAQKEMENILAKNKLDEISDWVNKQKELYDDYFDELWKVKKMLTTYSRVRNIIRMQANLVKEYQTAFGLFKQDEHFADAEIRYMEEVYVGILEESIDNLDQLGLVINTFSVQMSDGERMAIIEKVETRLRENYDNLQDFNEQNSLMSLQRAKSQEEVDVLRKMYGL